MEFEQARLKFEQVLTGDYRPREQVSFRAGMRPYAHLQHFALTHMY